jgi:hypothetical protein
LNIINNRYNPITKKILSIPAKKYEKYSIQNINTFTIMTPNDSGKRTFHFVYNFIEPSAKTEGRQHLFSLKKVKDKYHIVSAWTIP